MSGDVQPRKRKDKKKRKDEINVDDPRGTAAALGEGDVFLHSHHDHGTGGHWCAKIIFFSLLAVLVTLIGLIILENRGLTELEANAVESRYSGVLNGWIEDGPDDHHDEHTLELKHHENHDDDQEDQSQELDQDLDDHSNEDDQKDNDANSAEDSHNDDIDSVEDNDTDDIDSIEDDHNDDNSDEDQQDSNEDDNNDEQNRSEEQDNDEHEDINAQSYKHYYESNENNDDDNENDDLQSAEDQSVEEKHDYQSIKQVDDEDKSIEQDADDDDNIDDRSLEQNDAGISFQQNEYCETKQVDQSKETWTFEEQNSFENSEEQNDEDETHEENVEEDSEVEIEKIEKEISDEELKQEAISNEVDASAEKIQENYENENPKDEDTVEDEDDDDDFLEPEDIEAPVVEHITAPAGKPLRELEDDVSIEKPINSLAEEEEYENRQEELRREKEQASHMWLKVVVGGALLVATHAVVRRATATRDEENVNEHSSREETPTLIDRRMTLLLEEQISDEPVEVSTEYSPPVVDRDVEEQIIPIQRFSPIPSKVNVEEKTEVIPDAEVIETQDEEDKELYSDEYEMEEEELIEEKIPSPQIEASIKTAGPAEPVADYEEDPEDVEIIDEEQLEEEFIEEEEEISDVDDAELLSRLEAKYGRLPEPERPKTKDGGNNVEDDWPGEPSDSYWRQQLDEAEQDLRQGEWSGALGRVNAAKLQSSARARYIKARSMDSMAEARRDNKLLSQAIVAYIDLLKMNERLSDNKLLEITNRTLERIKFRGTYLTAEPVYKLLIRRFPDNPNYRNNLTVSLLMANRADLAEKVIRETLEIWPNDSVALAHLGFILKTSYNRLEEAVEAFKKALKDQSGPANEPRFYYHYGDALLQLGRFDEAHELHKRGAALGHFLSPNQRSLYNVERLKSKPWWDIDKTPYSKLARALERSWKQILAEGENMRALYEQEKEGLKERGEWSQLDLFVRGAEIPGRCKKAPVTCSIVKQEVAAVGCRRGQIKFSAMEAGTHVRPHVGPTNCRLRMHLGLSNTKDTYLRVDKETRQWQKGKTFMFDDSFEHEVWHNGTGPRLVLIVDVWHPDLTHTERRQLPAI